VIHGAPGAPAGRPAGEPAPKPKADDGKKKGQNDDEKEASARNRARVIVELPKGAKLYIDDKPMKAGKRRTFRTPALQPGEAYYYEIRAEVTRDGKPVTETRRVIVRAGQSARADFRSLGSTTATANAR
jgi:uncharacterized protein (TIGR03000 family)